MLFSSILFMFYFLPIVLLVYYISPKPLKNPVLLISSLVFYGWGEPRYVFLMIGTILVGYIFGLLIYKYRGRALSKILTGLSVVAQLSALIYFKYADFFISNFNMTTGLSVPLLKLVLPIGISFYTFQILSYTVDVYRGDVMPQKNIINLATYVSLFPQLIAGPIVRYSHIEAQLTKREHSFSKISDGIRRFVIGFGKKILIANTLGELCEAILAFKGQSVLMYWLYAVSFMLQIYFDFSGYSDMAIGLGKFFGFEFMENFSYPLISKSITEFWRRWHISLGSWFRDYVYIPLGGNRVKRGRLLFNIFVVWFLTGFWHGAQWNFIVWGLCFGILLTLEKFFYIKKLDKHKIFGHIYVMFFVIVSFAIFSGNNMGDAICRVKGMFGFNNVPFISQETVYSIKNFGVVILLASLGATPLPKRAVNLLKSKLGNNAVYDVLEIIVTAAILFVSVAYLADGSFNPFLYFRF